MANKHISAVVAGESNATNPFTDGDTRKAAVKSTKPVPLGWLAYSTLREEGS